MKTGAEVPSILTIHQTGPGQYVLRVGDLKWRSLVVQVSKMLEDAKSLIVVTPADIKVLTVGNGVAALPPSPNEDGEVDEAELDPELQAAIKAQEAQPIPGELQPSETPTEVEVAADHPAQPKVVRRKRDPALKAGHGESCGRCRGTGKTSYISEGGGAGEAPCPVCRGTGEIIRYGSRR